MRRIASIWLPRLAIERWAKTSDSQPEALVVLTIEGAHGPVIHAVSSAAAARGARPGARLTDARTLEPRLIAVAADPEGDAALLDRLARWAQRWSPLVEVDGTDALRLEVTGVAHLFGGEQGLVEDVQARFAVMGLTARVAIAPTAAAAWSLAHIQPHICPDKELEDRLAPLPASVLRLDPETTRTLERLGLKTIGALMGMPRLALARRFRGAEDVVEALDRLTGRKAEPLIALANDPPPRALLRLEEPALHEGSAIQALDRLIPKLVEQLEERHLGARLLTLTAFRVDGSWSQASVATSIPSREPKHLRRLLEDRAALDPAFGFDAFTLEASRAEPLGAAQDSLVDEPDPSGDLARLVDRLSVKLGADKVRRPQRHESYLPERASRWVEAVESSSPRFRGEDERVRTAPSSPAAAHREARRRDPSTSFAGPPPLQMQGRMRPQRLLDWPEAIAVIYATPEGAPRRFVWRRQVHDIARFEGPERIGPEWWRERSTARLRDYYRIEDDAGRRYWIYREGLVDDGRGGPPAWFMHGLFG